MTNSTTVPPLFQPIEIGGLRLENRIVVAPMCQYSTPGGEAGSWHTIHLGQLALSGAGLLVLEATAVTPEGRISPLDLGLWDDRTEAALGRVLATVREHAATPIGIQLSHAGRKASVAAPYAGGRQLALDDGGWNALAPSSLTARKGERMPTVLDQAGLDRLRDAFANAARRAARIGIDTIQLHFAHGYLLHQFLSPLSNQRDDRYGGSLENRMRFPLEVFRAVRDAFPADRPVGIRVSATDWVEGGWDLEQTVAVVDAARALGCAHVDVSSGGLTQGQNLPPLTPGYQVHLATAVREATGVPTMTVGLITEPQHANQIITDGKADMVSLGRGMLFNPHWPWQAAAELGATLRGPRPYWRAAPGNQPLFDPRGIEER